VVIGIISLVVAISSCGFTVLSAMGLQSTTTTDNNQFSILGCCAAIGIIFGILGLALTGVGLTKRANANQELAAADAEEREVRRGIISLESQKPQN